MSQIRQTQQTQDPSQRISDKTIVSSVLGGDYGRDHGIGRKIKRSVFGGDIHSSQPSTSQTQPSRSERDAEIIRTQSEAIRQLQDLFRTMMPPNMTA